MSKPTVSIIYGFGEGEWHGRAFRSALQMAGFSTNHQPATADIVIAHSAGCFYLPNERQDQLTILIGPSYWPGKPLIVSFWQKVSWDFKDYRRRGMTAAWFYKTLRNTLYIIGGTRKARLMIKNTRRQNFYAALRNKWTVIIRNQDDSWLTPNAKALLGSKATFSFHELPGQHDDCWINPEPYVRLLQSEYEQRR
jgi:hypothetical protein